MKFVVYNQPVHMRLALLILLLGSLALTGCATHYTVVMNNGRSVTATSKPKLDPATGRYVFTTTTGERIEVSKLSVREITPQSMQAEETSGFKSSPSK